MMQSFQELALQAQTPEFDLHNPYLKQKYLDIVGYIYNPRASDEETGIFLCFTGHTTKTSWQVPGQ